MNRIIKSSLLLVAVGAIVAGGTGAFFTDTETSTGNVFTAGNIDLTINHTMASYNGENCVINCTPTGQNLVENGSFETPTVTANGGGYEFFPSIPEWTLEAGSVIEVQRNAFASSDGQQHVELDGDGDNPATTISQTIATVPGERYRLTFDHSRRPQSQALGSGIRLEVAVVSPGGITFSDTITTGTGPIDWSTYTYEFIADDTTTTIRFAYDGTVNTFGGLLDNVEVFELACAGGEYEDTPGGFCELWDSKDLASENFFDFTDVKPQDEGSNLISMTVESNEAYLCLATNNQIEEENSHTPQEVNAGDTTPNEGELGQFLQVVGWYSDENGSKLGSPLFGPTLVSELDTIAYADSTTGNGPVTPGETQYVHLEWCMGKMTISGNTMSCDGLVPDINQAQTDALLADLQFYAIQSRNNDEFVCADVTFEPSSVDDVD
jgi:predicted ribosomally synthesized peptide with SipW-like signal peptide